jgi:hypothetical protein
MKIIAKKIVYEFTENSIHGMETIFEIQPNETVEQVMQRVGLTGVSDWHFDYAKVELKLVKP